jgi:hypothetical protein
MLTCLMCWTWASPCEQESYTFCNFTYNVDSGIAMLFASQGKQQQWPPLTENSNFKSTTLVEFAFIYLKDLKYVEHRKSDFFI